MKNWINKHLRKGKCVLAIYIGIDRRVKFHYVIPQGKNLTINGHSYVLNEDDLFLYKGMPSYILTIKNAEPIKINPLNQKENFMTADDYNTAISSQVAKEIFLATKKGFDSAMLSLILMFVLTIGLVVVAYLGSEMIASLQADLDAIKNVIGIGG